MKYKKCCVGKFNHQTYKTTTLYIFCSICSNTFLKFSGPGNYYNFFYHIKNDKLNFYCCKKDYCEENCKRILGKKYNEFVKKEY